MNFKQFLIEFAINNRYELAYNKLIYALDDAHVTTKDSYYEFNLGSVIKDSAYNGLTVRIQRGPKEQVKLGRHSDGRNVMVMYAKELPERSKIDSLLSDNKDLLNGFIDELEKFTHIYKGDKEQKLSKQEKRHELLNKDSFEKRYEEFIKAVDQKFEEYDTVLKDLKDQSEKTVSAFKMASLESAKQKLKADYFGATEKEFIKKMFKLPEAEFIDSLEKEMVDKLTKRLENYYEQKF